MGEIRLQRLMDMADQGTPIDELTYVRVLRSRWLAKHPHVPWLRPLILINGLMESWWCVFGTEKTANKSAYRALRDDRRFDYTLVIAPQRGTDNG